MKLYLKSLWEKIKGAKTKVKVLLISILVLYVAIACVCLIPVSVKSTSPGGISLVSNVIEIEGENTEVSTPQIYTVHVYQKTSVSVLEYLISKIDSNTVIEKHDYKEDIFTIKENNSMDVIAKEQSIQDSIISAFNLAKENGYDVNLNNTYKGIRVAYVPANYYQTGPESIQIGDIITKIGDKEFTNKNEFTDYVYDYYQAYKLDKNIESPVVEIIRDGETKTLLTNNKVIIANLGNIANYFNKQVSEYYYYEYYEIDGSNSNPKITINDPTSTGPSGGLLSAIYVYDIITGNTLINDKYIIGTGTISKDGSVGDIGSVKQKVITASYTICEYFLCPSGNYEEALEQYNKIKDPLFELYAINTLKEAIEILSAKEDVQ